MTFVSASASSSSICQITGGCDERRAVFAARENRPFVEPEAVDVHLLAPSTAGNRR